MKQAVIIFSLFCGCLFPAVNSTGAPVSGNGLAGTYFGQENCTEPKLVRVDPTVNFNWGSGSPDGSIQSDWFSVRWIGMVRPKFSESYTFYVEASDGVRLWVNHRLIFDSWNQQGTTEHSGTVTLNAHQLYDLKLEYFESTASANVKLSWSSASTAKAVIPKSCLFSGDALHNRVRSGLRTFSNWLTVNSVKGYIGEFGWPDDIEGEEWQWNSLADAWLVDADSADLPATIWATGEWYSGTYFSLYEKASGSQTINTNNTHAAVFEAHPGTTNYVRGINNPGGEYGGPNITPASDFSNQNIGIYNTTYHFDSQATYNYFAGRGNELVRIPFRWERVQQNPGGSLNSTELQRLEDAVTRARNAGLKVNIDMHNYGAYYLYDSGQNKGLRRAIGSAQVTTNHFADVWQRLSAVFKNDSSVEYGLMNEPVNMGSVTDWKQASQAAVSAIRGNSDNKLIYVGGYNWSGVTQFPVQHPTDWIADSANNIRYEAHHYWDSDGSGGYADSYGTEVYKAEVAGFGSATLIAETEALSATVSQGTTHTVFSDYNLSNGQADKLNATGSGHFITYEVEVPEAGTYTVRVGMKKQTSRGKFQLSIGGANQGSEQDNYSPVDYYVEASLGQKTFTLSGTKQFKFTVTGKNAGSSGYTLAIDYIKLTPHPLEIFYECENIELAGSSGDTVQIITDAPFRDGQGDKFNANAVGDYLAYLVDVPEARSYRIKARVKKQDARGIVQLAIDGANQSGPQDHYSAVDSYEEIDLGTKSFSTKGKKEFKFTITGKNASSVGYSMLLDVICLIPQ